MGRSELAPDLANAELPTNKGCEAFDISRARRANITNKRATCLQGSEGRADRSQAAFIV